MCLAPILEHGAMAIARGWRDDTRLRENHSCRTTSTTIFLIYFNKFHRIFLDWGEGGGGKTGKRGVKTPKS
jgi:hypothetical protein